MYYCEVYVAPSLAILWRMRKRNSPRTILILDTSCKCDNACVQLGLKPACDEYKEKVS